MKIKHSWNLLAVGMVLITASACSTIEFYDDQVEPSVETYNEYHHMAGLDLVEVSDPIDMKQRCDGKKWRFVKTERTFVTGVVNVLTQPFYSPWEVSYGCTAQ